MNILIISLSSSNNFIGGEDQIALLLKSEFESLGHTADICDYNNFDENKNYNKYNIFFSLNVPIKIKNKQNAIWAVWIFNTNLGSSYKNIIKYNYDIYFTNSNIIFEDLKKEGFSVELLNFAPSNYYYRKSSLIFPNKKNVDVLYLGNYNPSYKTPEKIADFLIPCMDFNFYIYGGIRWKYNEQKKLISSGDFESKYLSSIYEKYYQGIYPLNKCFEIADKSKIFINFNSPDQLEIGCINNRIFDLVFNGCFVITDDSPQQKELFGDIVDYSSGGEDLRKKIKYYLDNENEIWKKQKKSLNFSKEILSQNSYTKIAKTIINKCNNFDIISNKIEIKNKNIYIIIIVNDISILDYCIKSVKKNGDYRYCFYINKNIRIHSKKIISENLNINNVEINIVETPIDYFSDVLDFNKLPKNDLIIPLYSNVILKDEFVNKLLKEISINNNKFIFSHNLIDINNSKKNDKFSHRYGSFTFLNKNCIFKEKKRSIKSLNKDFMVHLDNVFSDIILSGESERKKFFYISDFKKSSVLLEEKKEINGIINKDHYEYNIKITYLLENYENNIINDDIINDKNIEVVNVTKQDNLEEIIRNVHSHYVMFSRKGNFDFSKINRIKSIICSHSNCMVFKVGKTFFIKTSFLYKLKPSKFIHKFHEYLFNYSGDIIILDPNNFDFLQSIKSDIIPRNTKGLKVAVLSMCGVSSFEDKYGIGGEHQVVHWLKNSFEKREDVYYCHIFDTLNISSMNANEYDIVFSNSCWRNFKRTKKDGLTIFWHFNMDSGKADMNTLMSMKYDWIWTNSYIAFDELKSKGINVMLKQLNASSQYHYPYPYESSLYKEINNRKKNNKQLTYIGGYQIHYKGMNMIDKFIRPCLNQDFSFAIYGNNLWKSSVQKKALEIDSTFKKEFYDESFNDYYRKILPMQDFNILCKNADILINFNAESQRKMQMNNDRVIWGLACGAFFITDDTKEARRFYEEPDPSQCPVVFSTGNDDLVNKIYYYLKDDEKRKKIASRGPEFVKKNRLMTDNTVSDIIDLYYKNTKNI